MSLTILFLIMFSSYLPSISFLVLHFVWLIFFLKNVGIWLKKTFKSREKHMLISCWSIILLQGVQIVQICFEHQNPSLKSDLVKWQDQFKSCYLGKFRYKLINTINNGLGNFIKTMFNCNVLKKRQLYKAGGEMIKWLRAAKIISLLLRKLSLGMLC